MTFADIFSQLKELEKKFNEISYPSETTFQSSFSSKVRKTEQDCLEHRLPAFEVNKFFQKVEK